LLVDVHVLLVVAEGVQAAHQHQRGEQPVEPVAAREEAVLQRNRGGGRGSGVHCLSPKSRSRSRSNSRSTSSSFRLLESAMRARAPPVAGLSQTQSRRSRTYSMAKT